MWRRPDAVAGLNPRKGRIPDMATSKRSVKRTSVKPAGKKTAATAARAAAKPEPRKAAPQPVSAAGVRPPVAVERPAAPSTGAVAGPTARTCPLVLDGETSAAAFTPRPVPPAMSSTAGSTSRKRVPVRFAVGSSLSKRRKRTGGRMCCTARISTKRGMAVSAVRMRRTMTCSELCA